VLVCIFVEKHPVPQASPSLALLKLMVPGIFGDYPNISATFGVRAYVDWAGCTGAISAWRDGLSEEKGVSLVSGMVANRIADFNASKSNSIYSDAVSKPTVDGLRVLSLVRAF